MVQLNTSNCTTTPSTPIILNLKKSGFQPEPDWIRDRDELTDSYKRFYGHVVRRIGKRGFAFLSVEKLAKDLRLCSRTISRHVKTSRELGLMEITPTGRSLKFVIVWHSWMGITEDEANQQKVNLTDKTSCQIRQNVKGLSPQAQPDQVDTKVSERLETIIIEPNEEIRSMHACCLASISTITDTKIDQEKEPITNAITNTTTSTSNNDLDKSRNTTETINSIYTLEIILRFVLAYARMKLGSNDEIKDHQAFANYCLESGEKDPWIAEFINNNYTLSAVNPLKDYSVGQPEQPQKPKQKKISPEQARKVKGQQQQQQTTETQEVKGKYPYQVYLDFANYELKQGKSIYSVKGLADWLYKNGSQDAQVGEFIELMRNTYAGGEMPCTTSKASETQINFNKEKTENKELSDLLELGKQRFEQLEDYEQAELQEMKLVGADFFFTCSMNVQNALLGAIREEIYLELAKDLVGAIQANYK